MKKKKKNTIVRLTKETPEARKTRVSSGVKYRAAAFADKKRRLLEKYTREDDE